MSQENIDVRILQAQHDKLLAQFNEHKKGGPSEPPGGDGVEARVARLESDIEYIKRDVSDISHTAKVIQGDVNHLKTQGATLLERTANLEKNMVTKGQLAAYAFLGLLTIGGAAIGIATWIIQNYLAPILANLPPQ